MLCVEEGEVGSARAGTFAQFAVLAAGDFVGVVDAQLLAVFHHRVDPFVPLQVGRGKKGLLGRIYLQNKCRPSLRLLLVEILYRGSRYSGWTNFAAGYSKTDLAVRGKRNPRRND